MERAGRGYAGGAWAGHHLAAGDAAAAVDALELLDGPRPADNRDRWAAHQGAITDLLGPDHPDTLTTRHNLASWRGRAGDPAGAATAFAELLTDRLRVLGTDHPHTLTTRGNLAYWRGHGRGPAQPTTDEA